MTATIGYRRLGRAFAQPPHITDANGGEQPHAGASGIRWRGSNGALVKDDQHQRHADDHNQRSQPHAAPICKEHHCASKATSVNAPMPWQECSL
jgi:hypothetical protein